MSHLITAIRKQLSKDWKYVGFCLELDNSVMNVIGLNSQDSEERAFKMMCEWMQRNANACYCQLINAMDKQGLDSGIKALKNEIKLSTKDSNQVL